MHFCGHTTVFCSQISTLGYKITRLKKSCPLHKENYNLNEEIQRCLLLVI